MAEMTASNAVIHEGHGIKMTNLNRSKLVEIFVLFLGLTARTSETPDLASRDTFPKLPRVNNPRSQIRQQANKTNNAYRHGRLCDLF